MSYCVYVFCRSDVNFSRSVAVWATRLTLESDDKKLQVRTTLKELVVYILFLVLLSIGDNNKQINSHSLRGLDDQGHILGYIYLL